MLKKKKNLRKIHAKNAEILRKNFKGVTMLSDLKMPILELRSAILDHWGRL